MTAVTRSTKYRIFTVWLPEIEIPIVFHNTYLIQFEDISYLREGSPRQQQAYQILTWEGILDALRAFDPLLCGTLPLRIDIPSSDLDIICCWKDRDAFKMTLQTAFGSRHGFSLVEKMVRQTDTVIATFVAGGFFIEVFGQAVPSREQDAFRHMLIEDRILRERGEEFRRQIIALKEEGFKTEPAFCHLLGLDGDPYMALLKV